MKLNKIKYTLQNKILMPVITRLLQITYNNMTEEYKEKNTLEEYEKKILEQLKEN